MPHAAGWTLGTARILYSQQPNSEILENVLHYDMAGLASNAANATAAATAIDAYVAAGIAPLMTTAFAYIGASFLLDDGLIQAAGVAGTATAGSAGGAPYPQVICAIMRKRCNAHGRRRFGHLCHLGIDDSMVADENHLSGAFMTSLNGFYAGLNDAPTLFGVAGSNHIIYHRDLDTRDAVFSFQADSLLKTQRHRTPGRGI